MVLSRFSEKVHGKNHEKYSDEHANNDKFNSLFHCVPPITLNKGLNRLPLYIYQLICKSLLPKIRSGQNESIRTGNKQPLLKRIRFVSVQIKINLRAAEVRLIQGKIIEGITQEIRPGGWEESFSKFDRIQ